MLCGVRAHSLTGLGLHSAQKNTGEFLDKTGLVSFLFKHEDVASNVYNPTCNKMDGDRRLYSDRILRDSETECDIGTLQSSLVCENMVEITGEDSKDRVDSVEDLSGTESSEEEIMVSFEKNGLYNYSQKCYIPGRSR